MFIVTVVRNTYTLCVCECCSGISQSIFHCAFKCEITCLEIDIFLVMYSFEFTDIKRYVKR